MKIAHKIFLFAVLFCASLAHCMQQPLTQLQIRSEASARYPVNHGSFYHKERAKIHGAIAGFLSLVSVSCFYAANKAHQLGARQEAIPHSNHSLQYLENAYGLGAVLSGASAAYFVEKIMYHNDRAKEAQRTGHCGCQ